ncbi:MAG: ATP-binding domain-containing protein, partial [Muribaculaceae bacterium]|nr:ATP-binding domain-containing protein [Muribaculaceae bacterium]
ANGDIVEVHDITGYEQKYGFRFADVTIGIPKTDITFPAKLMIDTLNSETPGLSQELYNKLYYSIMEDPELFGPYTPADARLKALKKNPYWNALQVKYAYAVTCHKAQGGQWKNVFVDASYIPPDAMGLDFYRWLYTAVTRASRRLFLIRN